MDNLSPEQIHQLLAEHPELAEQLMAQQEFDDEDEGDYLYADEDEDEYAYDEMDEGEGSEDFDESEVTMFPNSYIGKSQKIFGY